MFRVRVTCFYFFHSVFFLPFCVLPIYQTITFYSFISSYHTHHVFRTHVGKCPVNVMVNRFVMRVLLRIKFLCYTLTACSKSTLFLTARTNPTARSFVCSFVRSLALALCARPSGALPHRSECAYRSLALLMFFSFRFV